MVPISVICKNEVKIKLSKTKFYPCSNIVLYLVKEQIPLFHVEHNMNNK